jgi:NAD(P)H-dependent FMN reductase
MTNPNKPIAIAAISGSLRAASINSAVLRAAARLAPADITIQLLDDVRALPLFNPDLDNDGVAESVLSFRRKLIEADGVLIACPEYAHGVPGALKNALDWVVASNELVNKPLALLNAAPRASIAQAALRETLTVMSAQLIDEASVTLPIKIKNITEAQILEDVAVCDVLRSALQDFAKAIRATQVEN